MKTFITLVGVALLATVSIHCDSDDDGDTQDDTTVMDTTVTDTTVADTNQPVDTVNPQVAACTAAIQAKETTHASDLTSWSIADAAEMTRTGGDQAKEADYAGKYRDDLATHPGCARRATLYDANAEPFVSDNEATVPTDANLTIAGYDCAAKFYDKTGVDTAKPIVILVHGNSSGVTSFEEYANSTLAGTMISNVAGFQITADTTTRKQLATSLLEAGYEVIAFDAQVGKVATLSDWNFDATTGNPFMNIDHGWAVPMAQSLIKAVMKDNPTRKVSVIGHSLGTTVIRDALRRLYNESEAGTAGAVNPFAQLNDVILASGANHGVSSGDILCQGWLAQMKGTVGCEMGDRGTFVPTYFSKPLNGPGDVFGAPCADGDYAYGETGKCGGNVVDYTTITMKDVVGGDLQDEFISEASSRIDLEPCVDNELIELSDYDSSAYFFTGAPAFFANHFGSVRSDTGIALILSKLAD